MIPRSVTKYGAILIASLCLGYILYLAAAYIVPLRKHVAAKVPICKGCNVLLIAIDPLRVDALHVLGNPRSITPTLDSLSKQGFLFTNAVAASSWTLPSAMSLMTGTYPSVHKITNKELISHGPKVPLIPANLYTENPQMMTLASVLRQRGYVTAGFGGGAALDPSYGFGEGFDTYSSPGEFEGVSQGFPKALEFAKKHVKDQMFIFLHGFDVHGQYMPPTGLTKKFVDPSYHGTLTGSKEEQKALREQGVMQQEVYLTPEDTAFLRAIYDEKIERLDQQIAVFLAAYRSLHVAQNTIIIFTSDHGDEFYEHGRIDHGMTLYDEVIHVPLVIVLPGSSGGIRITDQVRNIDIMPTILSLVGVAPPPGVAEQMEGASLIPTMKGLNQHLDAYAETAYRYATFKSAIRTWDGWKLIYDQDSFVYHVFHVRTDPKELTDYARQGNPMERQLIDKLTAIVGDLKRRGAAY